MTNTVTVLLRGGLGNQMFEYATGFALAKKNGAELILDTTFLNDRFPRRQITHREYDLDIFDLDPRFTKLSKISSSCPIPVVWLGMDLVAYELQNLFGAQRFLKERPSGVFDDSVLRAQGSVVLWGFWQSGKYFEAYDDEIRAAFHFHDALASEAAKLAEVIRNTNSVSLHVRRGDYLFSNNAKLFDATGGDYYERAIARIGKEVADPHFFIFSDDIAWCREHIKPPFPTVYIDKSSEGPKASFHLQLMSLCKHNVIAKSSFSWWGAWLNRNPGKIVVAPESKQ